MSYKGYYKLKKPEKYLGDKSEPIVWRSLWERYVFCDLEDNPNVVGWASESIRIPYISVDGKPHTYYPDLYVKIKENGVIVHYIVEIKPFKETRPPDAGKKKKKTLLRENIVWNVNRLKWKAAMDFCKKKNIKFILVTEKNLRRFK